MTQSQRETLERFSNGILPLNKAIRAALAELSIHQDSQKRLSALAGQALNRLDAGDIKAAREALEQFQTETLWRA